MDAVQTLGKYEIRGTLGRGAMGTVYDGWDPRISRRVAIKTVTLPADPDPETAEEIARFRREAQAAGSLSHPNIVAVYDFGETADLAYIVMEFVGGPSLKGLLDKKERFAVADIVAIMEELLAGLQFSHSKGVVHRDIKPANVMMTLDRHVKIADFGIARIEQSSMTQAGTMMGTPAYMSPEQFMGQTVDARTDVYSAGVLLYQLLTGERPFEGAGLTTIMQKVLNTEALPPSQLSVVAPRSLDAVVLRAIAKRPEGRYASAADFAKAIRAAFEAPVSDIGGDAEATLVARAAPSVAEAPRAQAAASVVPDPALAAQQRKRSGVPVAAIAAAIVVLAAGGGGWYLFGRGPTPVPAQTVATLAPMAAKTPAVAQIMAAPAARPAEAPVPAAIATVPPAAEPTAVPAPVAVTKPLPSPVQTPVTSVTPAPAPIPAVVAAPAPQPALVAAPTPAPAPAPAAAPAQAPAPAPIATLAPAPVPTPEATPAPAPLPPPAPTQVTPTQLAMDVNAAAAAVRQDVNAALRESHCALASAEVPDDGPIVLTGITGDPQTLLAQVGKSAGAGRGVQWTGETVRPTLCRALELARSIAPDSQAAGRVLADGVLIDMGARTGVALHEDQLIQPSIVMPEFAGNLRVDYVANDGTITHLFPTLAVAGQKGSGRVAAQLPRQLAGHETLALGRPGRDKSGTDLPTWPVGEPFGTDMIVAIASSVPLKLAPATNDEDQKAGAAYLGRLAQEVERVQKAGGRVSGTIALVHTLPK